MQVMISFCITVYNQPTLVKRCIDSIVPYEGNDIEIVISDDGSTEDIKGLVERYHDNRIKYFANKDNLGHDRNIVNALSKSRGQYAFLLRTRDLMIPDTIPILIKVAEANQASYITGEAINQDGDLKIQYTRECFRQGSEAIEANYNLFIHPSGSMYRLSDLDLNAIADFLDTNKIPKNGFIVHNMIRLQLATTGAFWLVREPVWIYTDTESDEDRAVNRSRGGVCVYDPSLSEKRYQYEVMWAKQILRRDDFRKVYYLLTALYLDISTWGFKLSNSDKKSQHHYDYKEIDFSASEQRKRFRKVCESLYDDELEENINIYRHQMNRIFLKNRIEGAFKYVFRKLTYGTKTYNALARFYKKYIKGL